LSAEGGEFGFWFEENIVLQINIQAAIGVAKGFNFISCFMSSYTGEAAVCFKKYVKN